METTRNVMRVSAQLLRASSAKLLASRNVLEAADEMRAIAEELETTALGRPDPADKGSLSPEESADLLDALDKARASLSIERRHSDYWQSRERVSLIDAHIERLHQLSAKFDPAVQ